MNHVPSKRRAATAGALLLLLSFAACEVPSAMRAEQGAAEAGCHPGRANTTTREVLYHEVQNTANASDPCPAPTAEQEGDALDTASNYFDAVAARYCSKGKCEGDKECVATVSNRKSKKTGTRREFVPNAGQQELGTLRCYLVFELSGDISCSCK